MIIENNDVITFSKGNMKEIPEIPQGKNFLVKKDPISGEFFLEKMEEFTLPSVIYGDLDKKIQRYLTTFNNRDKNLGILLKGYKGTGKSLLAKKLCIDSGLPVIVITTDFSGTAFQSFLSDIKQECIVLIDEFEKVYSGGKDGGVFSNTGSQNKLLTILDGVFEGKKLFLLTANDSDRINDAFFNRPGRIHYIVEYDGLTEDVMDNVVDDLLDNKRHKKQLMDTMLSIGRVNMDCLVTIINEMNLFKETAKKSIAELNIRPEEGYFNITWTTTISVYDEVVSDTVEKKVTFSAFSDLNPLLGGSLHISGRGTSKNRGGNDRSHYKEADLDFDKSKITVLDTKCISVKQGKVEYIFKRTKRKNKYLY